MEGIIYKYTDKDGKVYIGQTINEEERILAHYSAAKNLSDKSRFHTALREKNFEFDYSVIVRIQSDNKQDLKDSLDMLECYYIYRYRANNPFYGYNGNAGHIPMRKGEELYR